MLRFFRQIRQRLLTDNKFSKYLLYAIGEILLVVIGILIALQIDNWNEANKEKAFEQKVLREMLMDVKEDLNEMANALDSLKKAQDAGQLIVGHLNQQLAYHDSLNEHFADALKFWSLAPNMTSFDMAKAEGMYFITNDSIRFYVSKVNGSYFDYVRVLESRFQDYLSNVVLPYTQPLFYSYNITAMEPINYEALKHDATYLGIIRTIIPMRTRYRNWLKERYEVLNKLHGMLQKELE